MRCAGGNYSAETEDQEKLNALKGEVKLAVMKGDTIYPDVLACSLYETKPVHIILTVADNVKWNPIKKKVYSKIEKKTVDIKFHRLNVIHK